MLLLYVLPYHHWHPLPVNKELSGYPGMAADVPKIVLTPLERSHHFGRRECVANEVLKVGRSVDRRRISPNNLIFDCRVLSRNHAQIWFENGKVSSEWEKLKVFLIFYIWVYNKCKVSSTNTEILNLYIELVIAGAKSTMVFSYL